MKKWVFSAGSGDAIEDARDAEPACDDAMAQLGDADDEVRARWSDRLSGYVEQQDQSFCTVASSVMW